MFVSFWGQLSMVRHCRAPGVFLVRGGILVLLSLLPSTLPPNWRRFKEIKIDVMSCDILPSTKSPRTRDTSCNHTHIHIMDHYARMASTWRNRPKPVDCNCNIVKILLLWCLNTIYIHFNVLSLSHKHIPSKCTSIPIFYFTFCVFVRVLYIFQSTSV